MTKLRPKPNPVTPSAPLRLSAAPFKRLLPRPLGFLLLALGYAVSCTPRDSTPSYAWTEPVDSAGSSALVDNSAQCQACLSLFPHLTLGETDGPGFLEETYDLVQDSLGRYWVGQRGGIKVFDPRGQFIATVGRTGQGPLEFSTARPMFTGPDGSVHIIDPGNGRRTIVRSTLELQATSLLPGFIRQLAPLADGRAVANMWLETTDAIGMPLHLIQDDTVAISFGLARDTEAQPQTRFTTQRVLTVDVDGHIFSSPLYAFEIDAWTEDGRRINGWRGEPLNQLPVEPGRFSHDNPIPNTIIALQAGAGATLWVLSWRRRAEWLDMMQEGVTRDGDVTLTPRAGVNMDQIMYSQVDVLDLHTAEIVARIRSEPLLLGFLGTRGMWGMEYTSDGAPIVSVWRLDHTLR